MNCQFRYGLLQCGGTEGSRNFLMHPQKKTLWKYLSIDFSPISEIVLLYERHETSVVCRSENIRGTMKTGGSGDRMNGTGRGKRRLYWQGKTATFSPVPEIDPGSLWLEGCTASTSQKR